MKNAIKITILLVGSIAISLSVANAQNMNNHRKMSDSAGYNLQNLNLSPEQAEKISKIRKNRNLTASSSDKQKLRAAHQEQIKVILSPEQRAMFEAQINQRQNVKGKGLQRSKGMRNSG